MNVIERGLRMRPLRSFNAGLVAISWMKRKKERSEKRMSNTGLDQNQERQGLNDKKNRRVMSEKTYISVNSHKCVELDLQEFHLSGISKNEKRKNRLFYDRNL